MYLYHEGAPKRGPLEIPMVLLHRTGDGTGAPTVHTISGCRAATGGPDGWQDSKV